MENHHFLWVNQLFLWPFSIAMFVYQRVNGKMFRSPGHFRPWRPSHPWVATTKASVGSSSSGASVNSWSSQILPCKENIMSQLVSIYILLYYIILHYIILLYYIKLYKVYNMYHSWYNKFLPDYPSSLDFLSYMFIMSLNTHAIFLAFSRHWTQQTELVRQRPHGKAWSFPRSWSPPEGGQR